MLFLAAASEVPSPAASNEAPEVVSVRVSGEGLVAVDDAVMRVSDFTNSLRAILRDADLVAFYAPTSPTPRRSTAASVLSSLSRTGTRLLVVQEDGSYKLPAADLPAGETRITLSTEEIERVLDFYDAAGTNLVRSPLPVMGLTFQEDDLTGGYRLDSVKVGIGGRSVWIVHRGLETETPETTIELKKEW